MRLIGCLSWFDEPVDFLTRTIRTSAEIGVEALVVVDGGYRLLPGARPTSDPKEAKAIMAACRKHDVELLLHEPSRVWDSEIEKRNSLFRLAASVSEKHVDWWLVLDADYDLWAKETFLDVLAGVDTDVVQVHAHTPKGPNGDVTFGPPERTAFRAMFRAQEIEVVGNHYTYMGEGKLPLWGNFLKSELAPATNLSEIVGLTHWTYYRPKQRNARQYDYYRARDADQSERGMCVDCGAQRASVMVPRFVKEDDGTVVAALAEVCADCHGPAIKLAQQQAVDWNLEELVAEQQAV